MPTPDIGLLISICAILIALWSGRSALTQAQASLSQASSARDQAGSARSQANSAKIEELTAQWSARLQAMQGRYDLLNDKLERALEDVAFFRAHAERCEHDIKILQEKMGLLGG